MLNLLTLFSLSCPGGCLTEEQTCPRAMRDSVELADTCHSELHAPEIFFLFFWNAATHHHCTYRRLGHCVDVPLTASASVGFVWNGILPGSPFKSTLSSFVSPSMTSLMPFSPFPPFSPFM